MFMFDTKVATVRPYLLLGAALHEQDYALLRGAGVTHILQIGSELHASYPDKFQYLRISIDDLEQEDIVRHFSRCFEFIDGARQRTAGADCAADADRDGVPTFPAGEGKRAAARSEEGLPAPGTGVVLVHCMAGMSRSASVVVSYLMWSEKLPYTDAFRQVKAARPCIYPNLGFLLQLWEWEASGCDASAWAGWNKVKFAERLAEYRRAQTANGLHQAVRVRLPMPYDGATAAAPQAPAPCGAGVPPSSLVAAAAVTAAVGGVRVLGAVGRTRRAGGCMTVTEALAAAGARAAASPLLPSSAATGEKGPAGPDADSAAQPELAAAFTAAGWSSPGSAEAGSKGSGGGAQPGEDGPAEAAEAARTARDAAAESTGEGGVVSTHPPLPLSPLPLTGLAGAVGVGPAAAVGMALGVEAVQC